MATPTGICLKEVETGNFKTFGSIALAAEFLGRSKWYINQRTLIMAQDNIQGLIVEGKDRKKYYLSTFNGGKRRDAKKKHKPPKPKIQWQFEEYEIRHLNNQSSQLCTRCARASGFCEWSKRLQPVEGWDAIPTIVKHQQRNGSGKVVSVEVESYHIKGCPLYMEDGKTVEERRKQRKMLLKEMENGG